MKDLQKSKIEYMRKSGSSYSIIADKLGLSINTVKSYCRRNGLGTVVQADQQDENLCLKCGAPLVHTPRAKRRKFCSDECRMAWWNEHPEAVKHKNTRTVVCGYCGHQFTVFGKRERKYCSRACYGKSKAVQL
jgi:endogenous inhibitor of DNA gyrase (YacG/DUF329 family)